MGSREELEKVLEEERGMSFTRLKRETSLENGALSYHVKNSSKVTRKRKAIVHKQGCKECPLKQFCTEVCIYKLLESKERSEILLRRKDGMRNSDIADEIGLHRSTVSYHISLLEKSGLLEEDALRLMESEDLL